MADRDSMINMGPQTTTSDVDGTIQPTQQDMPTVQQGQDQPQVQPQQPQAGRGLQTAAPNSNQDTSVPSVDQHTQKAGIFRSIFEALAGPQTPQYKINPKTGQQESVPQPKRGASALANSIVAGALTGLFASAGEKGPNSEIRAFAKGGQANADRLEQQDQQAQALASQNFQRSQGIVDANMRSMNNAIQYGKMDREAHQSMTDSFKSQLEDINNTSPEMVLKSGVSEAEAKDMQTHSAFDVLRIPDGTVPRLDKDGNPVYMNSDGTVVSSDTPGAHPVWDNTYSLINKDAKTNLSDENGPLPWVKQGVEKWGGVIPGLSPSLLAGNGAKGQISAYLAGKLNFQVAALDGLQKELDQFTGTLNDNKDKKDQLAHIDLKAALKSGALSLADVQNFQRTAGLSTQPDIQIDALRAQHPDSAAKITALFNSQGDHLEDFKQARDARKQAAIKEAKTSVIADENDAKAVLANPKSSDEQKAAATSFLQQGVNQSANRAEAEERAKIKVSSEETAAQDARIAGPEGFRVDEGTGNLQLPELMTYLKTNGVEIPKDFDSLYSVGAEHSSPLNKIFPTRVSKGTNQTDASHALEFIHKYINPKYSDSDYNAAQAFNVSLANPAKSPTIAAGVASQHLGLLYQAAQAMENGEWNTYNDIKTKLQTEFGGSNALVFKALADQVNQEVGKVVSGGPAHVAELEKLAENLDKKHSEKQQTAVIKTYIGLMSGRLNELNAQSNNYFNRDLKMSDNTTQLFKKFGFETPWERRKQMQQQSQQAQQTKTPPAGKFAAKDRSGNVIGYADDAKGTNFVKF